MHFTDYHLPLEQITSYLRYEGWQLANENSHWLLFEAFEDIEGKPLQIALYRDPEAPDFSLSVYHSLRTLTALNKKTPDSILQDILTFNRDILEVRVDDAADTTSVSIEKAAKQIHELKQLVLYGATSERSRRQHYGNWLPSIRPTLDEFAFGHTVAGSFGFRLEAKLVGNQPSDKPTFPGFEPKPMSRFVMERIMRGLAATEQAVSETNTRPLVEGYRMGFNSNMCEAIANISQDLTKPVRYNIKWSRVFEVPDDLMNIRQIEIHDVHRRYLEAASKELAAQETTFATIKGVVRSLDSKGNPRSDDVVDRTVKIYGGPPSESWRQIHLTLEKDDYLTAIKAHDEWLTISVSGYLSRTGTKWLLQKPEGFQIIR